MASIPPPFPPSSANAWRRTVPGLYTWFGESIRLELSRNGYRSKVKSAVRTRNDLEFTGLNSKVVRTGDPTIAGENYQMTGSRRNYNYQPQWRIYGTMICECDVPEDAIGNEWHHFSQFRGELWRRGLEDNLGLKCASGSARSLAYVVQYITTESIDLWDIFRVANTDDDTRRHLTEYQGQESQNPASTMAHRAIEGLPAETLLLCFDRHTCSIWNQLLWIYMKHWLEHFDGDSLTQGFANCFSGVTPGFYSPVDSWYQEEAEEDERKYVQLSRSESRDAVRILLRIWKQMKSTAQLNDDSLLCIWAKYV